MKIRPGLVVSIDSETIYVICKITKTDRSDRFPGEWVPLGSQLQSEMGLHEGSFIDISNIKQIPRSLIRGKMGEYPEWEDFYEKYKEYIPD